MLQMRTQALLQSMPEVTVNCSYGILVTVLSHNRAAVNVTAIYTMQI